MYKKFNENKNNIKLNIIQIKSGYSVISKYLAQNVNLLLETMTKIERMQYEIDEIKTQLTIYNQYQEVPLPKQTTKKSANQSNNDIEIEELD